MFCIQEFGRTNLAFLVRAKRLNLSFQFTIDGLKKKVKFPQSESVVPRVWTHFEFEFFINRGRIIDWNLSFSNPRLMSLKTGISFYYSVKWTKVERPLFGVERQVLVILGNEVGLGCFAAIEIVWHRRLKIAAGKLIGDRQPPLVVTFLPAASMASLVLFLAVSIAGCFVWLNLSGVASVSVASGTIAATVVGFAMVRFSALMGENPTVPAIFTIAAICLVFCTMAIVGATTNSGSPDIWYLTGMYVMAVLHVGLTIGGMAVGASQGRPRRFSVPKIQPRQSLPFFIDRVGVAAVEFVIVCLVMEPGIAWLDFGFSTFIPTVVCILSLTAYDMHVLASRKAFGVMRMDPVILKLAVMLSAVLTDALLIDWATGERHKDVFWASASVLAVVIGGSNLALILIFAVKWETRLTHKSRRFPQTTAVMHNPDAFLSENSAS
jgi:hypothetical protein